MVINYTMKIFHHSKLLLFYSYLSFIIIMYVRPVTIERILEQSTGLDLDKYLHFFTFFLLGFIAQLINTKNYNFIFGISLSLIISLFIEISHFIIPYRDFEILDGLLNIIGCITGILMIYLYRKKI